jgi:hypothetical protein
MARLISRDVTISVTFLGNQSGTAGSFIAPSTYINNTSATTGGGSSTQYTATTTVACRAKSYSRSTEIGMVESGAMCDLQQFNRPTRLSGTVEMELNLDYNTVSGAGLFLGKEGWYVNVLVDLGQTRLNDLGLVASVSTSAETDGSITEQVTITLGVDGANGTSPYSTIASAVDALG